MDLERGVAAHGVVHSCLPSTRLEPGTAEVVNAPRRTLRASAFPRASAPVGGRTTQCLLRIFRTAEDERSVSSASAGRDRPAALCPSKKRSTRACATGSGRGEAVPASSASALSCRRGGCGTSGADELTLSRASPTGVPLGAEVPVRL